MRHIKSNPVLAGCCVSAVLLVCLGVVWWLVRPSPTRHSWDEVQVGVTTDAELEAWFGPPAQVGTSWLTVEGERVTTTDKQWWREDHSYMEVMLNEEGVVVYCQHGMRLPTRFEIWRRTLIEEVFD